VTHQLQVERRTEKVRRLQTDVLPLCHATNPTDSVKAIKVTQSSGSGMASSLIHLPPDSWRKGHISCVTLSKVNSRLLLSIWSSLSEGHINLVSAKGKERRKSIYIAPFIYYVHLKALRHGSHSYTCKLHHACFSFVSIHQMAQPLTEVADIKLQLNTHLSTPKG